MGPQRSNKFPLVSYTKKLNFSSTAIFDVIASILGETTGHIECHFPKLSDMKFGIQKPYLQCKNVLGMHHNYLLM